MLVAYDSLGMPVKKGDAVRASNGRTAKFVLATRARTHHSGKVVVIWNNDEHERQAEYYDKVFALTVKEVTD